MLSFSYVLFSAGMFWEGWRGPGGWYDSFGPSFVQIPSGATPAFSEGSSKVDLISFVVKHVGVGGTQLLTSAGLNYS